jgi:hypothetical protein
MEKNYYPSSYDYKSLYRNIYLYRGFEGGAVYLAEGSDCWVIITNEGTLIGLLSEEDQIGLAERAVCIYSFATQAERDEFAAIRFSPPQDRFR